MVKYDAYVFSLYRYSWCCGGVLARKDYRKIKDEAVLATAWLTDTSLRLSTRIPHASSHSGSGAVYGTIIIGNGPYWDD